MNALKRRRANPRTTSGEVLLPLTTSIPKSAWERLRRMKIEEGVSPAMFARRAILLYLREAGEPAGKYRSVTFRENQP